MRDESFSSKYFTETIYLDRVNDGAINFDLLLTCFKTLAKRDVKALVSDPLRQHKAKNVVVQLVNTPRRYHRFQYALKRRIPMLLDEVDDYDIFLIAALEACDSSVLRIIIEYGDQLFLKNKVPDVVDLSVSEIGGSEAEAFQILLKLHDRELLDKYFRARAKDHWRAAFLGFGSFARISKWIGISTIEDHDSVASMLKDMLSDVEIADDIVVDVIRAMIIKYDAVNDLSKYLVILKVLQESGKAESVAPTIAAHLQKELAGKDPKTRFKALEQLLSLCDVPSSFHSRLYFYLVEDEERGGVVDRISEVDNRTLSEIFVSHFKNGRTKITFDEDGLGYLARLMNASKRVGFGYEQHFASEILTSIDDIEKIIETLLSLRFPAKPTLSENAIDYIDKVFGLNAFVSIVKKFEFGSFMPQTAFALHDLLKKYQEANGDVKLISSLSE